MNEASPLPLQSADRLELYKRLGQNNSAPLWEVLSQLVTAEPRTACQPAVWAYADMRPLLMDAGRCITAQEAERRVLILQNPGLHGASQITQSLYAGIQLVLPGESAPSHRHVASALRFVLESDGAYTDVDGKRVSMQPGDFIVTPSWTFHEHGNPGRGPAIWLDGLDVPIVNLFDSSFAQHGPGEKQPTPPPFHYPYANHRERLEQMRQSNAVDPHDGIKLQYVNPATGGYPIPTIAAFLQLLPGRFRGAPYRATDATIFCVVEGAGSTTVGDVKLQWGPRDVFVVPSWHAVSHQCDADSVLFSFSDRPSQLALGLWREDRNLTTS